jgi:hypothetical protein
MQILERHDKRLLPGTGIEKHLMPHLFDSFKLRLVKFSRSGRRLRTNSTEFSALRADATSSNQISSTPSIRGSAYSQASSTHKHC